MAKAVDPEVALCLQAIEETFDSLMQDPTIPRNIRQTLKEALDKLQHMEGDKTLAMSSVIYMLDDSSNDINMPSHTRTEIWGLISKLESLKEKFK